MKHSQEFFEIITNVTGFTPLWSDMDEIKEHALNDVKFEDILDALDEAITGLEWWRENYPQGASDVFFEKVEKWKTYMGWRVRNSNQMAEK